MAARRKVVIATHDGMFHADEVFAVAALLIVLDKAPVVAAIVRTRNVADIHRSDFVVDVGLIYLPEKNRFDHHQIGGAGIRPDGIPYASFGLVWQKYGADVAGSETAARAVDRSLVAPIDARDSGTDIFKKIFPDVTPYVVDEFIHNLRPTWREDGESSDAKFLEAVGFARKILEREVVHAQAAVEAEKLVREAYEKSADKRCVVLPAFYPFEQTLSRFPEPLFAVLPRADGTWAVKAIRDDASLFKNRKDLPLEWAGKRDVELANITGVPDAVFAHASRFMAVARTKDGAVRLAQIAVAE